MTNNALPSPWCVHVCVWGGGGGVGVVGESVGCGGV